MRPRRAALLTPPSPTPAFLQNVAKPCVCHTCDPSPLLHFISFSSSFSRHESLATSKFPRSWLQICPFIFKQLQDAPPATLFFSCFCMVARGCWGASPQGLLPSAQCSLSRIPAQSLHLRSPHPAEPVRGFSYFPPVTSHQSPQLCGIPRLSGNSDLSTVNCQGVLR